MPPATRNVTPGPSAPVNHNATMASNSVATADLQSHRNVVNWREKNHQTPKRGGSELLDEGERDRKKAKVDLRTMVGGINGPKRTNREEKDKKRNRRRRKKKNLSTVDSVQHQERHPSVSTLSAGPAAESMTQSTIASIAETASVAEMISEDEQPTYSVCEIPGFFIVCLIGLLYQVIRQGEG